MAGGLMRDSGIELWQRSLDIYTEVVRILSDEKAKRKKGKEGDTLASLDHWYQEELPKAVTSRDAPHLTREELTRLMKWKLTRGKFRPRLTEMIQENSTEFVISVTTKGFSQLPNVRKAIEILTQLKAVGPATASAILCIVSPDMAPFMSDESTQAVPGLGQLNYSLKQYLNYASALRDQADELGKPWTAHKVELALWSCQIATQLKPELLSLDNHNNDLDQSQSEGDDGSGIVAAKKRKMTQS